MMNVVGLFSLKGKTIAATGATGYLCQNFLEACAQDGADIAAIDMPGTEEKLESLSKKLQSEYGVRVRTYTANIVDEERVQETAAAIQKDFGAIDGLINSAGINIHGKIADYTEEDYTRLMKVNVSGTFVMCKHFGKIMCEQKHGSIVNIASFGGTIINKPPRTMSGYCTSKAAVLHLTRAVAGEYGEYNVRCNSVSPGFLEHGMSNVKNFVKLTDPAIQADSLNNTPMHRVGAPHELAGAVLYLLSDASSFTTGIDIIIDGGYQLW